MELRRWRCASQQTAEIETQYCPQVIEVNVAVVLRLKEDRIKIDEMEDRVRSGCKAMIAAKIGSAPIGRLMQNEHEG